MRKQSLNFGSKWYLVQQYVNSEGTNPPPAVAITPSPVCGRKMPSPWLLPALEALKIRGESITRFKSPTRFRCPTLSFSCLTVMRPLGVVVQL